MFGKKTPAPLDGRDTLLLDLDGVVYRGPDPIDHAVVSIQKAAKKARIAYLTNNAARTDASVAEHLSSFGLTVAAEDVVTSPQAALRVLGTLVAPGALAKPIRVCHLRACGIERPIIGRQSDGPIEIPDCGREP